MAEVPMEAESVMRGRDLGPRFKLVLALLVGTVAVSAAFLAWVESEAGRNEDLALTGASRDVLDAFVGIAVGNQRAQFELNAQLEGSLLSGRSAARASTASLDQVPLQVAITLGIAENSAGGELLGLSRRLGRLPESPPGIDERTVEALSISTQREVDAIYASQEASLASAERYGARQQRAMYGLSLLAVAASLVGLAGLIGATRGGRIALGAAAGALLVAVGVGASGLVL